MITVFAMAAVLWGIGAAMGSPKRARWIMIGMLLGLVIGLQLLLPAGHPLREATGGDVRLWVLILAFSAIGFGYRRTLRFVQAKANERVPSLPKGTFSETELERYARHIMLREIGGSGQRALKSAKVLVVGAGGLGSPVLQYLAAAGVGTIGVIDDDTVEITNLQRQIIHTDARVGMTKVISAAEAMTAQNPHVTVRPYGRKLTHDIAAELFAQYDFIVDGTDNFETRFLVNATCVALGKPLIAGALTQWEGQVSLYDPAHDAPCYACVFPHAPDSSLVPSCAQAGVVGPLPGIIGSLMAVEVVKEITSAGESLRGRLYIYDALYAQTRVIAIKRRDDCSVCAGHHH